jgi:hypothetical protein
MLMQKFPTIMIRLIMTFIGHNQARSPIFHRECSCRRIRARVQFLESSGRGAGEGKEREAEGGDHM